MATLRELKAARGDTTDRGLPTGRLEATLPRQIVGGLVTGARHDILAGPIINLLADVAPGIDQEYLDLVERSIDGKPAASVAKFIGEFGAMAPQIFATGGVGRLAIGGLMRAAALRGAQMGAVTKGVGQFGKLAAKATDIGGDVLKAQPKLAIERAAEIAGANVAIGGYFGVKTAVEGGTARESLEQAAIATIIGGVFETGVAGIGLLTKHGRSAYLDQNKFAKAWETTPIGPNGETGAAMAAKIVVDKRKTVTDIRDGIHKLLDTEKQVEQLVKGEGRYYTKRMVTVPSKLKPSQLAEPEQKLFREIVQKGAGAKADLQAARRLADVRRILPLTRRAPFSHTGKRAQLEQALTRLIQTPEGIIGEFGETMGRLLGGLKFADDEIVKQMAMNAGTLRQLRDSAVKTLKLSNKDIAKGGLLRYASAFERGDKAGLQKFLTDNTTLNTDGITTVVGAFDQLSKFQLNWFNQVLKMGGRPAMTEQQLADRGLKRFLTHIGENLDEDDMLGLLKKTFDDDAVVARIMQQARQDPLELDDLVTIGKELGIDASKLGSMSDLITPETLTRVNMARNRVKVQRGPQGKFESRMPKFGAFDFTRTLGGTLETKAMAGLPVLKDPFDAALRYTNAASRRVNIGKVIGPHGDLLDDALDIAAAEGANSTLARNIVAEYLDNKYYSTLMRDASKFLTGVNVASKMTLGVMANMSQTANTTMMFGMKNLLRGFNGLTRKENRIAMEEMLALNHSMMTNIGRMLGEEGIAITGAEKMAEWVLKYTGFSAVERVNRLVAGSTAFSTAKDIITKGTLGRLRGNNLDKSRRLAKSLGFELDDVIKNLRAVEGGVINEGATLANLQGFLSTYGPTTNTLGHKTLFNAAFLGAQKTQFIPSKFRRPLLWNHPLGRVAFQFKTFALQQGRLLRDQVFGEAAAGNMAPLAYFMSVSPLAGELVGDMKAFVRGSERGDDMVPRVLENFMYLGGFGLFTDLWQSTAYGDFSSALLGPSFGTAEDIATGLAKLDAGEVARPLIRMPVFQAAHAFYRAIDHTTDIISEYVNQTGGADRASGSTTSRNQLLRLAIEEKQATR